MKTKNLRFFANLFSHAYVKMALVILFLMFVMNWIMNQAIYASNHLPSAFKNYGLNNYRCFEPIDEVQFKLKHDEIAKKYFDETKLTMSKDLCLTYCITSKQAADLMKLFSLDSSRTDFAKYAIDKVVDPANFYVCKESFVVESHQTIIDELMKNYNAQKEGN